jgi:hypothetical protein
VGFKKAFKKLRKGLHLPAVTLGNVGKAAAVAGITAATGGAGAGLSAVALSKLKSAAVGGLKQHLRTKAQKLLAKKIIAKVPKAVKALPASTMPGGAPLKAAVTRAVSAGKRRAKAAVKRRVKAAVGAAKGAAKKRSAPKGGKDFKALSAAWKAAGKPGKWIDWVKSH